jgi:hypothetical protein
LVHAEVSGKTDLLAALQVQAVAVTAERAALLIDLLGQPPRSSNRQLAGQLGLSR